MLNGVLITSATAGLETVRFPPKRAMRSGVVAKTQPFKRGAVFSQTELSKVFDQHEVAFDPNLLRVQEQRQRRDGVVLDAGLDLTPKVVQTDLQVGSGVEAPCRIFTQAAQNDLFKLARQARVQLSRRLRLRNAG